MLTSKCSVSTIVAAARKSVPFSVCVTIARFSVRERWKKKYHHPFPFVLLSAAVWKSNHTPFMCGTKRVNSTNADGTRWMWIYIYLYLYIYMYMCVWFRQQQICGISQISLRNLFRMNGKPKYEQKNRKQILTKWNK